MANTYTPQTWTDGVSTASAARMGVIETGVQGAWARELNYTQFTSNVSVTATTEATANTVVTAGAVTFDGSTVAIIEFFAQRVQKGTNATVFVLYDGASSIGLFGLQGGDSPVVLRRRLTPSAAAHTYSVRAYVDAGTGTVVAGAGGIGVNVPGFIRIERA